MSLKTVMRRKNAKKQFLKFLYQNIEKEVYRP